MEGEGSVEVHQGSRVCVSVFKSGSHVNMFSVFRQVTSRAIYNKKRTGTN